MSGETRSPDQLRTQALAIHSKRVVQLGTQLDEMLKLISHNLEALTAETFDGMGYKKMAADLTVLRKLKELSAMFGHITDAKIRYDKAMKTLAETLTPEEERDAVKQYVKAMERIDRGKLLMSLLNWHNEGANVSNHLGLDAADHKTRLFDDAGNRVAAGAVMCKKALDPEPDRG